MKPRVLMIGPAEGAIGGIATLVETFTPLLRSRVELLYLPTAAAGRPSRDGGRFSVRNLGSAVSQVFRFAIAMLRFRPQIVHVHTSRRLGWLKDSVFVLMGKGFGSRVVIHVHGDLLGISSALERRYTVTVLKVAEAVIVVADTWRRKLGEAIPISRIHTFVNCIDTNAATVGMGCASFPRALFLGRAGEQKGIFDLVESMQSLHEKGCQMHLTVAGEEATAGALADLAAQAEIAGLSNFVHIVGRVHGNEKWELLAESDIFVLPSYTEQLPIALLEAMAAGCAIVATNVGGIPDVVDDGFNGLLVNPGDVPALAQSLETLCRDAEFRRTMGQRNRVLALQKLDVVPYVDALVEFYRKLLQSSGQGAGG